MFDEVKFTLTHTFLNLLSITFVCFVVLTSVQFYNVACEVSSLIVLFLETFILFLHFFGRSL